MSNVLGKDRSKSKFDTGDACLDLMVYTTNILSNEKVFTPKYQKNIDSIAYEARMIYHCVRTSNYDIKIKDPKEEQVLVAERLRLQVEALRYCTELRTDIAIAKPLFHLRAGRIRYWNQLLKHAEDLIKKWHKSEIIRYGM
jgi:hypothetical protein